MAMSDRSGRMSYEHFSISPSESAVDPLPTYGGSMGGLTTYRSLEPEPSTVLTISIRHSPGPYPFNAQVAQYEFQSMAALKEKLTQFPSGTKFRLTISPTGSSAGQQTLALLRDFLSSHGMSVAGAKQAN